MAVFSADTDATLRAAVTLANSALAPETMTTLDELARFYRRFGYSGRRDGDAAELTAVRNLRPRLRELLTSDAERAAEIVNAMLTEARAVPQLVRHEPYGWHIHAVERDDALATRIQVEIAMAMIDVVRAGELSRLGVCANDDCEGIVLDLSRNRSRRFCSTACGNRHAAAAYRARAASA